MKFSTTLVATFASLSVAAPAHKRQADDTASTDAIISDVLPGITGEEPIEDTTTSSSSADALAAADPYDIYRVPAVTPTFPMEQNDFTGIQGVQSISEDNDDDDDLVDAAISSLTGVGPPLTTGTATTTTRLDADADANNNRALSVDDAFVSDAQAQAMIDAAIRYAQQLPNSVVVPMPLSTGTPQIFVDPYLGNTTTLFSNSTTSVVDPTATTTTDGTDLVASLQALNDALASYQDLMNATATAADNVMTGRKIKMLGDDMLSGIQQMAKRAEMAAAEQVQNKTMKSVLRQRGMMANSTMFANKTEAITSKTVMDKMGRNGVLERYVKMVAGEN
ncbi:hypothetical protein NCU08773 [Neurospora crassa OR74A]|uniref:Uncharacterized protein n=2 Tax=Neurospora crassa TaxID=5141 RepID=Q1K4U7_NEUCR|nr:hypothetical protein NCU08773 [Neurospora crassa OR74A]EAA26858.1 hypothetical protein NCU08773 [Neurospora crassa OR74A]CAD70460.1 hypothetical protein [Neurospora crassa]|eukprot:XP_956094.1 hypothetical protein NCU08773 [Neurospora crassa OR74A]